MKMFKSSLSNFSTDSLGFLHFDLMVSTIPQLCRKCNIFVKGGSDLILLLTIKGKLHVRITLNRCGCGKVGAVRLSRNRPKVELVTIN